MKKRKSGFTMVEVIIVLMVISTSLITIIMGVTRSVRYVSEMKQRTIALNLAKEGVEAMYNIRDTNWRRRSASRDACWLKDNPMVDEENDGCENDQWIIPGRGVILNKKNNKQEEYFIRSPIYTRGGFVIEQSTSGFKGWIKKHSKGHYNPKDWHRKYRLHNVDGKRLDYQEFDALSPEEKAREDFSEGDFGRFILVEGLFPKGNHTPIDTSLVSCKTGESHCGNEEAKEFRFCVTSYYFRPYVGVVNICSIMTNFLE